MIPAMSDPEWDFMGARCLRRVSIVDIEHAIATALSSLVNEPLDVTIQGIDFGNLLHKPVSLALTVDAAKPKEPPKP